MRNEFMREKHYVAGALSLVVLGMVGKGLENIFSGDSRKAAAERCVSALVGHHVRLVRGVEDDMIQMPREIIDEFRACADTNFNINDARENLMYSPPVPIEH